MHRQRFRVTKNLRSPNTGRHYTRGEHVLLTEAEAARYADLIIPAPLPPEHSTH